MRRGTVGVYDMTPRGASRDRGMAAAHYGRPPSGGGCIAAIGLPLDVLRWTRSALISTPKSPNQLPFSRAVKTCTDYHVWFTCEKKKPPLKNYIWDFFSDYGMRQMDMEGTRHGHAMRADASALGGPRSGPP